MVDTQRCFTDEDGERALLSSWADENPNDPLPFFFFFFLKRVKSFFLRLMPYAKGNRPGGANSMPQCQLVKLEYTREAVDAAGQCPETSMIPSRIENATSPRHRTSYCSVWK